MIMKTVVLSIENFDKMFCYCRKSFMSLVLFDVQVLLISNFIFLE